MKSQPYIAPAVIYETVLEARAGTPASYDHSPSQTVPDQREHDDKDDYYAAQWDAQDARAAEAEQRQANQASERDWWQGN